MDKKSAYLKKLGRQVKKVRESKGYSQDRVYLESDISRASLYRIEGGLVDPQAWTLKRIAETIGVPLWRLFDFD